MLKSGLLAESDVNTYLNDIRMAENDVHHCTALVDRHGQYANYRIAKIY